MSKKSEVFSISEITIDGINYKIDPVITIHKTHDITMTISSNMKKIVVYPFVSSLKPKIKIK